MAALECCDLNWLEDTALPPQLPSLAQLQRAPGCQRLAARNQILLSLVAHRAFAFDLDNQGLVVRVVANFQGGGAVARPEEVIGEPVGRSSHAGIALGPHTESPYHCAVNASAGQSPAPSSLALSALWNPAAEPTRVIPLAGILDSLPATDLLALTAPAFDYTRSDCFTAGKGANGYGVSLLQFDPNGGFAFRYNSYRHTASAHAPAVVRSALARLQSAIASTEPLMCTLRQDRALLINNYRALHCREVVRDNRRVLVRLFGYSRFARPVVVQHDPLIVKG
ncbi:hypothetical protein [Pseudomonas sp. KNUC1026]|uniref:hypothetical protein n=1 Tax=Pseudomonas sp. KNUC1026 TaxID=2893890 RepID=UPI001F283A9E|nr:hypothetical protein [Pseudomonas sp. KNUC1026]UFH48169.1 hypothetical protein LN139_13255 [Pseudomonas sp. KNUC1026]